MRERNTGASGRRGAEKFGGMRAALLAVNHEARIGAELNVIDAGFPKDDGLDSTAVNRNHLKPRASAIFHGEKQARGIRRPGVALHPPVERFGKIRGASRGAFENHEPPAVAFRACASLRTEG